MKKSVIESGFFRFNDRFYHQKEGLAMGVKPAPPFAIIYVYCTVELPLLKDDYTYAPDVPRKPPNLMTIESWDIYIDDTISLGQGTENDVTNLFSFINSLNPHIHFEHQCSKKSLPSLDMTIDLNTVTKNLDFELYIKPSSLELFLNYKSHHPKNVLINSAKNEITRAIKRSSTPQKIERSIKMVSEILKRNNYPENVIQKCIKDVKIKMGLLQSNQKNNNVNKNDLKSTKKSFLCLPYVSEQHKRKTMYILRKNNLLESTKVTFTPGKKLSEVLVSSKLLPTACNAKSATKCYKCDANCMSKSICYELLCNICKEKYDGETGRLNRLRKWEHYRSAIKGNGSTAMGAHYRDKHQGYRFRRKVHSRRKF